MDTASDPPPYGHDTKPLAEPRPKEAVFWYKSICMDNGSYRGRIMFAMERHKKGTASLGKAAELAGVPVAEMIALLSEYGVKSNLQKEHYLEGLENLKKVW